MSRRVAILMAIVGLMVMMFAGVALAKTIVGDGGPNRLVGPPRTTRSRASEAPTT
jgi:hypothetical protein